MSALAHGLEVRGIPTTVIGLVRVHLEKSLPPRSLFVPFELGRPLGEPGDPAFQRDVLMSALSLLDRRDGPVILEDYASDAPGARDTPGWRPALRLPRPELPQAADVGGWSAALASEMAMVRPHYERAMRSRGRTTVGISQQAPEAWPDYAATFLGGVLPMPPPGLPTAAVAVRFLADDLKAFYGEAAQAEGPYPSSRQLDRWFWDETVAGALLQQIRRVGVRSDSNALKTVSERFLVPTRFVVS